MANAGPDTNGSQFFLVYADSALRPNYTIFGTVGPVGLCTLDRVAAGGIEPTADDPAPVDGAPARRTEILEARTIR
jgi:peptidyl-prolyl cis-trans isomerase B (cyclophilin B)